MLNFDKSIMSMKIVISPAKSLNFEKKVPTDSFSEAIFLKKAETIQKALKRKNQKNLWL